MLARGLAAASILFAGVATAEVGHAMGRWSLPIAPPGAAFTARVGVERIEMARATLADLRAFERAAANDPFADRDDLLDGIDRDVLIVFVESYGRASLDTPLYAATHRATLNAAEERLARSGCRCAQGCCARRRAAGKAG
jgi:hypothetical protein